jgi:23S rRNA (pseudouridine1915-N3)-methyltransferase
LHLQTITLIALGKLNAAYYREAAAEYAKRLGAFCRLRVVELPEEPIAEKNASQAVIDKALDKEAKAILAAVPRGAAVVALCIEGKPCTSEQLADWLQAKAVGGVSDVVFIIGSSHGLAQTVKTAAEKKLSMSAMTFPHQLARVMLLEQLYRAFSINAGTKYHK